jgi:signal transduction histidine kinase
VLDAPKLDARVIARLRRVARVLGVVLAAVGALVFVGWLFESPALDRVLYGRFILQLNAGFAFAVAGAGLYVAARESPRPRTGWVVAAGAIVAAVGAFVLVEELAGFRVPLAGRLFASGRMEPETALDFVCVGVALALVRSPRPAAARAAQALAMVAALIALAALFGHAYSVKFFFGVTAYTKMSVTAIVAFLVLAFGLLFAGADRGFMAQVAADSAAGFLSRRLYPAVIALPLLLGVLTLAGEELRLFNGKFGLSLLVLASIVCLAVLTSLMHRSLDREGEARLRLQAVLLEEAERRNLARELHDEIGQSLTALKLRIEMAAAADPGMLEAKKLVDDLMARVSSLSLDLRPAMLDDLGLLPALLWLFERYTAQTRVEVAFEHQHLDGRLPRELETAAFRIVQEALTNIARHAGCARAEVRVWITPDQRTLGVRIADAGRGFDAGAAARSGRAGLLGMRERAAALGGQLTIDAAPGAGARLTAELPLARSR